MKNIFKKHKIIVLLIILVISIGFNQIVYAEEESTKTIDFSMADDFIKEGQNSDDGITDLTNIGKEFSKIGNMLTFIGAGVLVGSTAYMGILYIISSPEKQAKLKQQLIGLVVSAIVIFGAYGIWKAVVTVLEKTMAPS